MTEPEAERLARDLYGLEAAARALPGEYDDNFLLATPEGKRFVLKVMHPARERAFVELQCEALRHLEQHAPNLSLPRVCPTRGGHTIASTRAADARPASSGC